MLKNILTDFSVSKILDVGTGRGELISCLTEELKSFDEIIAIDSEQRAMDFLNENFKDDRIKCLKMNATKLEFEDSYFDMVCISNTFHHLPHSDLNLVLDEMKRVLKPNGYFLICEMYCDNQTNAQMGHVHLHHFGASIDRLNGVCHNETFKRSEITNTATSLGLSIEKISDFADLNDPCSEEEISNFISSIDKRLDSIQDSPTYESLKEYGETTKNWLNNYGLCGATELVMLCKKL